MLKTTSTQFINFVYNIYPYDLVSLVQKVLCRLPKEKCKYQPSYKYFDLQYCLTCKICQNNGATNLVEVINQSLILLKA